MQGFLYAPFGEITNEYNSSFGSSVLPKYSFNAKELDEETGMYYYEARYMAPPVFISRDPLFEKYPTFSPYAYCANNPVKYIDPDGRDTLLFNSNGKYKSIIPAEGNPVGKIKQKDGSDICFDFADPENDVNSALTDPYFRVCVVKNKEIKSYLRKSKVKDYAAKLESLPWYMPYRSMTKLSLACAYLYSHSNAGTNPDDSKTLDYTCSIPLYDNILYVTKVEKRYTGHNGHNFGNFLWGASAEILGIPLFIARIGAHFNNYFISKDENGGKLDSTDDQLSISLGHKWARRNMP